MLAQRHFGRLMQKPPCLRDDNAPVGPRHATWFELFFDLVFVAAIAGVSHRLAHNIAHGETTWSIFAFAVLFIPVWWAWVGEVYYATRFDCDEDRVHRFLGAFQMMALAVMAATLFRADDFLAGPFAGAYAAVRTLLIVEYVRASHFAPKARPLIRWYLPPLTCAAALWWASAFTPEPWRLGLWGTALAIDLLFPLTAGRRHAEVPPHPEHLPERFGLFTILVLGETILAVVRGLGEVNWHFATGAAGMFGLLIAVGLWWVHFDEPDMRVVHSEAEHRHSWLYYVWLYAHLPLVMSIVVVGIGVEFAILAQHEGHWVDAHRWLLVAALATFFTSEALMRFTSVGAGVPEPNLSRGMWRRVFAVVPVLALGLLPGVPPAALLALLAAVLIAIVALDMLRGKARAQTPGVVEATPCSAEEMGM